MPRVTRWQDWLLTAAGVYVFLTPWFFDFTANTEGSWVAWVTGGVIFLLGLAGLTVPRLRVIEWLQVIAGAWLFAAPWVLGFTGVQGAAWNAWIAGPVVVLLALWAIYDLTRVSPGIEAPEKRYLKAA